MAKPPNIVVILADDMGFSDLGCYGGEIGTPNLDRLAREGLRFTQFYNTARCWPTRAAILTGYYAQQVRRDTLPDVVQNGVAGTRPKWAKLLPDLLRPYGYSSYHSGKWHLDGKPVQSGFDRSYWLEDTDRFFSPKEHFEDDRLLPAVPPGTSYYAATRVADHAIECLKAHAAASPNMPFFSYVAFTTPHFPLQAPAEDVARYRTRFRDGWDRLRERRLQRMKRLGIVSCDLSERTLGVPAWDSLSTENQERWQERMAVHAAMVDRMDQEIGRIVDQIRAMGALDGTAIFFLSDNGASAEKVLRGDGDDPQAPPGSAKTFRCLEPAWANLANSPLRLSKMFVHEGGISTSFIVHWPAGISARGALRRNVGHVIDIAPTIVDIASRGEPPPGPIPPVAPVWPGRSLIPAFAKDRSVDRDFLWWFHSGNRAYRQEDWKLVSQGAKGPWELYDLKKDRSEMHNLAAEHPDRAKAMERAWEDRLEEFKRDATREK
jgi:arylsulfatase